MIGATIIMSVVGMGGILYFLYDMYSEKRSQMSQRGQDAL